MYTFAKYTGTRNLLCCTVNSLDVHVIKERISFLTLFLSTCHGLQVSGGGGSSPKNLDEVQVHAHSRLRLKASLNVDLNVYLLSLVLLKFTVEGAELVNSFGRTLAKRNDVLSPFLICGITSMNSKQHMIQSFMCIIHIT